MISLLKVWHFRLGHPSINKLRSLQDTLCVDFNSCTDVCHIYPLAKHKRLHFPFNNNLCASPFDLVHVHIWGPYSVPTHECFRFFLSIVDSATRNTWVYFLKEKSNVRSILISFYKMIQTQFKTNIKSIRSDNGQEFAMIDFYNAHGIIHQKNYVYTPQ